MTTDTLTLTDFLSARIAEDEAAAWAAAEGRPLARWRDEGRGQPGQSVVWSGTGQAVVSHAYRDQGGHIARHDPARVLAECDTKRRIMRRQQQTWVSSREPDGFVTPDDVPALLARADTPALRDLASVYADHPDYRDEWRP
jgi:hypothetical protein